MSTATNVTPTYSYEPTWGRLPDGCAAWGVVPAVVVDSEDRVYVHRRAVPAVCVYSQEGQLLATWGDRYVDGAHGLHLHREADGEFLYFTDMRRHCIVRCDLEGRERWTLGTPGQVGTLGQPFNRPTDITCTPEGDFYVSDGYGNARVHHYDPDRRLIRSWGEPGSGPGQFNLVHDVWFDTRRAAQGAPGRLWVCDRMNHRLQLFSPEGEFLEEKTGFRRPNGIWVDWDGFVYVAELDARVTILDPEDRVVGYLGGVPDPNPGGLLKPHAIWGDARGDLYVAEVEDGARIQKFSRR